MIEVVRHPGLNKSLLLLPSSFLNNLSWQELLTLMTVFHAKKPSIILYFIFLEKEVSH